MLSQKIPNNLTLEAVIDQQMSQVHQELLIEVGDLEVEYKRISRRKRYGSLCVSVAGVISFGLYTVADPRVPTGGMLGDEVIAVLVPLLLLIVVTLFFFGWKLIRDPGQAVRHFNQGVNKAIFEQVLLIFEISGSYVPNLLSGVDVQKIQAIRKTGSHAKGSDLSEVGQLLNQQSQVLDLLDHSELITENRNNVRVDDMVHMGLDGRTLFVSELSVQNTTSRGRSRRTKKIFSGYFVSYDLPRTLTGKTFVSTEGDKTGFGHRTFWKRIAGSGAVETQLEWNDFEKLLHVATTDPTEARYVITPDLMQELHDWWQEKKGNIRISFIANRMYLLFPDENIRFFNTVPDLTQSAVRAYILSVASPLLHVLHLAERIR